MVGGPLVRRQDLEAHPHLAGGELLALTGRRVGLTGVSLYLSETPPGARVPRHRHAYDEVIVVQEGRATCTVGAATVEAVAGDLVVVPAGVPHSFVNAGAGGLRLLAVHAAAEVATEYLDPPVGPGAADPPPPPPAAAG